MVFESIRNEHTYIGQEFYNSRDSIKVHIFLSYEGDIFPAINGSMTINFFNSIHYIRPYFSSTFPVSKKCLLVWSVWFIFYDNGLQLLVDLLVTDLMKASPHSAPSVIRKWRTFFLSWANLSFFTCLNVTKGIITQ